MPDYNITVKVDSSQAKQGIDDVERGLDGVGTTADKLKGILASALAFVGITASVQQIIQLSDAFVTLQNRLRLVTDSETELANATQQVLDISNLTAQSVNAVADIYTKTILATDDLGVSTADATTFVTLLSQALATSGASAQTTEGILYQLGQALASNKLAGDEFRTTLEGAPIILDVLSAALNKSKGEILEMAKAGQISAPVLINAFIQMRDMIEGPFSTAILTAEQAFVILRNTLTVYVGELTQSTGAHQAFVNTILFVAANIDTFIRVLGALIIALGTHFAKQAVVAAIAALQTLGKAFLTNPLGAFLTLITVAISFLITFGDQIKLTADGSVTALSVMSDAFTGTVGFIIDALNLIIAGVRAAVDFIDQYLDIGVSVDGFVTAFEIARIGVEAFVDFISTGMDAAFAAISSFVSQIATEFPRLTAFFVSVGETIVQFGQYVVDQLELFDLQTFVLNTARELDTIVAIFVAAVAVIEEVFSNLDAILYDAFSTGLNAAIDAVESGVNFIIDGLSDLAQTMFELGVNAIKALADGLVNTFETVVDFAKKIPGLIKDAITGDFSVLDFGAEFSQAFADSIREGFDTAYDTSSIGFDRLATQSQGAMANVADVGAKAYSDQIKASPITAATVETIEEAAKAAEQRMQVVAIPVFKPLVDESEKAGDEIIASQKRAAEEAAKAWDGAYDSMLDGLADFTGLSTKQIEQLGNNVVDIFDRMGVNIKALSGTIGTDFANSLGIAGIVLDELGVDIENVFGKKASTAIRIFARLSSDQIDLIIRAGGGLVSFFTGPFVTAIQGAASLFGGMGEAASGVFDKIIAAGQGVLDFFGISLGEAAGGAFDSIVSAGQKVLDYFGIDLTGVIEKVKGVFGGMGDVATEEGKEIEEAGTGIADTFKTINDVITDIVDTIIGVFERLAEGISNILTSIAQGISNFLTIVAQGIGNVVTTLASAIGQGIISIAQGMATAILEIGFALAAVLAVLTPFIAVMLVLSVLLAAVALVFFAVAAIIEAIAALIEALVPLILGLIDAFSNMGFSVEGIFQGMADAVQAFADIMVALIQAAVDIVVALFQGIVDIVVAAFEAMGAIIQAIAQAIVATFQALGAAVTAIFQALGAAISAIFQAIGAAAQAIGQAITAVFQALGAVVTAIFQALGAAVAAVFQAMGAVASAIASAIGSFMSAAAQLAGSVWQAFGQVFSGIMNVVSGLVRAFGEIAVAAFKAGAAVLEGILKLMTAMIKLLREIIQLAKEAGEAIGGISFPGGGGGGGGGGFPNPFDLFAKGGLVNKPSVYVAPKGSVESYGGGDNLASGGVFNAPSLIFGGLQNKIGRNVDVGLVGEAGSEEIVPHGRKRRGGGTTVINNFQISVRGASREELDQLVRMVNDLEGNMEVINEETSIDVMEAALAWQ